MQTLLHSDHLLLTRPLLKQKRKKGLKILSLYVVPEQVEEPVDVERLLQVPLPLLEEELLSFRPDNRVELIEQQLGRERGLEELVKDRQPERREESREERDRQLEVKEEKPEEQLEQREELPDAKAKITSREFLNESFSLKTKKDNRRRA